MGSRLERRVGRVEMATGIRYRRVRMIWEGDPLPDDLSPDERLIIIGWEGDDCTPQRLDA